MCLIKKNQGGRAGVQEAGRITREISEARERAIRPSSYSYSSSSSFPSTLLHPIASPPPSTTLSPFPTSTVSVFRVKKKVCYNQNLKLTVLYKTYKSNVVKDVKHQQTRDQKMCYENFYSNQKNLYKLFAKQEYQVKLSPNFELCKL